MKSFVVIAALLVVSPVFAKSKPPTAEQLLAASVRKNAGALHAEIQAKVFPGQQGRALRLTVDWNSLRCVAVVGSEFGEKIQPNGVCTVRAGGFQTSVQAVIIANNDGQRAELIYADIE